jgi:hypothetical protein
MKSWKIVPLILAVSTGSTAASVIESVPNGFSLEQRVVIAASPEKIYYTLLRPNKWWSPAHTYTHDAANLRLGSSAGACFCEQLNGGSVEHARVVLAMPSSLLRLRGALGPFQAQGVDGALTFALEKAKGETVLVATYTVGGFVKGGFGEWPQAADAMLGDQVARLKRFVETGSPETAVH